MTWNYERTKTRIADHLNSMPQIEVKKLEREADLEDLLSETVCREIFGAHVYLDIPNFSNLVATDDATEMKRMIRAIHVYQRQLSMIIESMFDGVRVHFQGARVHVLFYRPIENATKLAAKAFLLMVVARDFLRYVFNPAFPDLDSLTIRGGADLGTVIGTQNGMSGDRELLFLGAPANHAAKILDTGLRLTATVFEALPSDLQEHCEESDNDTYRVATVGKDDVTTLTATHDIEWNRGELTERVEADIELFPLKKIEFSSATELLNFDALSIFMNKAVRGVSIFADLTGFTRFIDSATTPEAREEAIIALHLARKEFTRVIRRDFDGVRVQFQGDRVQALVHLGADDEKIARKATDIAIALQSSMDVLRDVYEPMGHLHLAVGMDFGDVIASRLGERGHRDRIVLGGSVMTAAANEERVGKRQIGITMIIKEALSEDIAEHFDWDPVAQCYVATGLTVVTLERKLATVPYSSMAPVTILTTDRGVRVTREEVPGGKPVTPARSFAG